MYRKLFNRLDSDRREAFHMIISFLYVVFLRLKCGNEVLNRFTDHLTTAFINIRHESLSIANTRKIAQKFFGFLLKNPDVYVMLINKILNRQLLSLLDLIL